MLNVIMLSVVILNVIMLSVVILNVIMLNVVASLIMLGNTGAFLMEQHTLKNVNNCLNNNIYSYLETSCGQSSNLNLNVVHFFNTSVI
jgi:hypothetical protein